MGGIINWMLRVIKVASNPVYIQEGFIRADLEEEKLVTDFAFWLGAAYSIFITYILFK